MQYCPGEICDIKNKQDVQKTSAAQVLILAGFVLYTFLAVALFNDSFQEKPQNLWKIIDTAMKNS